MKYKVWCKDRREWERDKVLLSCDGDQYHLLCGEYVFVRPNNHPIVFYSGRVDKNGKEIFEGDVLSKQGHRSIRIEFDKGMRVRDLDRVRYNSKILGCYVYDFDFTGWTIVGNIYENPELLEDK